MTAKRWRWWFGRGVNALALALVLIIAAWLVSNWNDAPPKPRPAALELPKPTLPDARNAAFALTGLRAAADLDPAAAGQAHWQRQLANAVDASRSAPAAPYQPPVADDAALGTPLPDMAGPPLICESHMDDCVARWIDAADDLRRQRDEHAVLGSRCERLLDGDFAFEEVLPPMRTLSEPIAPHGMGASRCVRWFTSGAVLAWLGRDRAGTVGMLAKADRLSRSMLEASHSLIGQMLAVRFARDTLGTIAALSVRDAALAAALEPMVAQPLPDPVHAARRWMAVEATFMHGSIADIERNRALPPVSDDVDLFAWLASRGIGWHPQRTLQRIDAQWLQSMQRLDEGGLHAAIDAYARDAAAGAGDAAWWASLTWVNPIGSTFVDFARPAYGAFLARQADVELHRDAVALVVGAAAAGVPAAQRRAWAATLSISATSRERITWSDDGMALDARTWQASFTPDLRVAPRDVIRVAWPPAQATPQR